MPLSVSTNGPYAYRQVHVCAHTAVCIIMCAGATVHALLNRGKANQLGQTRVSVGGCNERYGEPMRSSI